ncbi:hypothetical protein RRG08_055982 [Elysia crispata]|uniref:Uncharacterized protein n=1 Tax=Elysia crispata TaxID=231223 RepID=A0AAE1DYR6_9GAST|nr:hypothetical protein RRG08_055982 [Elysia crispata]
MSDSNHFGRSYNSASPCCRIVPAYTSKKPSKARSESGPMSTPLLTEAVFLVCVSLALWSACPHILKVRTGPRDLLYQGK